MSENQNKLPHRCHHPLITQFGFEPIVKKEGAGDVGLQLFMTTYHYIRREPSISPERFSDYVAGYGATLTDVLAAKTLVSNTNISVCNAILT